ncbi:MAG TPA: glycosyltransferase [Streptosporangiaceae bacterium]|nr:glycosyltransferase [Streptosporangiaceae bacterium]
MLVAIVVTAAATAAWLYLIAGHGGFWRTDQRLPAAGQAPPADASWPEVVAVVPARDEAAVLPGSLPTLLAQAYPGNLRVILVDDESSDGTAQAAADLGRAAAAAGARSSLAIVSGEPLPPGWAGKVWAMNQGLRAAGDAEYVLFTDADIAYLPGTVSALVRAARDGDLAMVSQMALLRAGTFWERMLIPAFVYFFAQLYPFRRVNRAASRTAAAAGGCMLVRRSALEAAGGLEPIRGARIDDVALGGLLKRAGGNCWLGFATNVISNREYRGLAEIWDMVARSAYTQLRYSPAALAGTVLGMAWLYLLPVAASLAGIVLLAGGPGLSEVSASQAAWLVGAGLAAWAIMAVTYVPVLRLSGLSALRAPCLPFIGVLYTAMTVSSALRHRTGRGGAWKGRTVPGP